MRVIILAAGQGKRLRPLTDDIPKCMVKIDNKPLISYQLELFNEFDIKDVNIVTGYLEEKVNYSGIKKYFIPCFDKTNMVNTLFCAGELFDGCDDILISYGDIIYNGSVLETIVNARDKINVVIDKNWKEYWSARMDDPLSDAETLKINENGNIKEIGKKAKNYNEIEGQYIGLIKIRKDVVKVVRRYYEGLDRDVLYEGNGYNNMYMTCFLQMLADNLMPLTPVYIENGWMEVDTPSDLEFIIFV